MNITVQLNKSRILDAIHRNFGVSYGNYIGRWRSYSNEKALVKSCYKDIVKEINKLPVMDDKYLNANEVLDTIKKYFDKECNRCRNKSEEEAVTLCESNINGVIKSQFAGILNITDVKEQV